MKTVRLGAGFLLLVLASAIAARAASADPDGKALYAPCVVCHQPSAWGSADGRIPSLAGQEAGYLVDQFAAFRSGARAGTAMQVVSAHAGSGEPGDSAALAGYLAALDVNPRPAVGMGTNLRLGQEIYAYICSTCHGFEGEGDAEGHVPRIAGQHYAYLRRHIADLAQLHLRISNAGEDLVLRRLSAQGKSAVADYLSRLGATGSSDALSGVHDASPPR